MAWGGLRVAALAAGVTCSLLAGFAAEAADRFTANYSPDRARPSLPKGCESPAQITKLDANLPRTAARLSRREPLTVVALGSSSTSGAGATSPTRAYPTQLERELERRLPGLPITVINRGVSGETVVEMLARLDRDVLAAKPDLVIWQLGTNTTLRAHGLDGFIAAVRDGLARFRAAGVDVVLMDMQYAPRMLMQIEQTAAMEHTIAELGHEAKVPVFRRYALMRHWILTGQLDFARMVSIDGLHLNDLSYRCIGRTLATAIVNEATHPAMALAR
jgi:acyl-CoA thioesterase-1